MIETIGRNRSGTIMDLEKKFDYGFMIGFAAFYLFIALLILGTLTAVIIGLLVALIKV